MNTIDNRYKKLKNYELETMFELSKKQKEQLADNVDPRTKHYLKLQELYLKLNKNGFEAIEEETNNYIDRHEYLLDKEIIAQFYELLAFGASTESEQLEAKYLDLSLQSQATLYTSKKAIYQALQTNNIYMAARFALIALENDIEFDKELSYYNLVVEHHFEDDPIEYLKVMQAYQDEFVTVDTISVEFSFNKLILQYYIEKYLKQTDESNKEALKAKKAVNELLLKTISSMKDENQLRSQVIRIREALSQIDNDPECNILELITFNIIPKPTGMPESSPFNKLR